MKLIKRPGMVDREVETILIKDSAVFMIGDPMRIESFVAEVIDNTSDTIYGIVEDIVDANGISLRSLASDRSLAGRGASWAASTLTFTAGSDNTSTDMVSVVVTPLRYGDEILATLDAAKGTTTGSDVDYYTIDALVATDPSQLDESTVTTTGGAFLIKKAKGDTLSTTQVIVSPCLVQIEV